MFNGVGWGEVVVLLLIGLFVFGPDRLPKAARDAGRVLRQLRQLANGMRNDLRSELGPEFADLDIRDLHPKTFVRKHLFEDDPVLPPYLTKRTSLDSLLLGDDPPAAPSLTKSSLPRDPAAKDPARPGAEAAVPAAPPGPVSPMLSKVSPSKASAARSVPAQPARSDGPATEVPFDSDAT
ncbi:Sec-independent protein translocase TatB [Frankia sp. CcI156]|uniref:Sec-independent protein translocase protein TatB n=3 Tax=Frankia casuarinae (strain DSM 45818 / CECT 9043 / HFP020203 / CcI3) TaxID=106370 RepID=TATB_FRACC|nr:MULTISPECIES: Sec-independent protein translocase protein TatB [Frankia]Q2J6B3.1 RecName: Full=Sec-independent protein translocase protein TatB [Frankia casuarinae]ABD13179.1 twin-arginine translocation protein TatB [Frankia casuarinae]ETA00569.1 Sec-independent protein secretion pathway component [Frankia sp. CcI6]EYT89899.1 Sec-independent protein secretion pathway component [Frankia casuarinae]KDA41529.1 Sec-independent protein secretion pathway component [Frankia sp. BMG5.23]KEZ36274.1